MGNSSPLTDAETSNATTRTCRNPIRAPFNGPILAHSCQNRGFMKKHLLFAAAALLAACTADNTALDSITADALMAHVRALASDEFEGRAPATKGEELT